ncbi:hypothetical protein SeMB42_g05220 [Synchytrium endobioticum]|uniref:Uncharacterized protein n=1 Tax=Synchytrium endobioticum TaxID=286115 RepID=A0A507CT31_9FUNG|nr:hypothetical protein SeMB42_g05220 [Synchytrium endobioticum]
MQPSRTPYSNVILTDNGVPQNILHPPAHVPTDWQVCRRMQGVLERNIVSLCIQSGIAKHAQLYGIETTMQPGTSCTASCMNTPLPSALVRSSAYSFVCLKV